MKRPHEVHVHIARLVVDAPTSTDARTSNAARDAAAAAAALAGAFAAASTQESDAPAWPEAVARSLAQRLAANGWDCAASARATGAGKPPGGAR